ncbi:hypothetical protein O181_111275 [Austropuccinia psidii MF-1]|uniref:Uncharacterized protein n=1 Tax=Austropuccinia psidii MF-1 TaxID=1389203 RepID=A0A9Q3JY25_9BASI|nr:hypothetical protein [Austropuccinia psidii MF-1]
MISPSNNQLSFSLAIPHQSSDHLTVGTQPNDHMIVNKLHVPKLSLIPHDLKPVGTQPHNHNDLTDENSLNHNKPKSRQQRRILLYMNQTADQLLHTYTGQEEELECLLVEASSTQTTT